VLLGGAALTRHYCEGHLRSVYAGEVFYGRDAFDGLRTMDLLMGGKADDLHREVRERQSKRSEAEEAIVRSRAEKLAEANRAEADGGARAPAGGTAATVRSDTPAAPSVPTPPFWGSRVATGIDLADVYPFINTVALFRGQWQVKKGALNDAAYDAMLEDQITPVFERLKDQCRHEAILTPRVVYGYYPVNSDGDDLIVWEPGRSGVERLRFRFPRQRDKRRLCISDYFLPADAGRADVLGLSCVTVGPRATEESRRLFEANRYTDYLYLHGLSVETTEALAEFWHKRMRQELGIAGDDSPHIRELFTQHYRGSRYSFGYPACPDMSDQQRLFDLLDPARIGCSLTENFQIDPEQSTSAIVVHHPAAKYFNV
jgi:5-methyltetrahydrofolate--homocysteine methyltransferase